MLTKWDEVRNFFPYYLIRSFVPRSWHLGTLALGFGQLNWRQKDFSGRHCGYSLLFLNLFPKNSHSYVEWWPGNWCTSGIDISIPGRNAAPPEPTPLPPHPTGFAKPSSSLCIGLVCFQPTHYSICNLCLLHQFVTGHHICKRPVCADW